jgi:hypothetical protein
MERTGRDEKQPRRISWTGVISREGTGNKKGNMTACDTTPAGLGIPKPGSIRPRLMV